MEYFRLYQLTRVVSHCFNFEKTMKSIIKAIALITPLIFLPNQAYALKCGTKLVEIYDRKHKVLYKCGEPTYTDSYEQVSSIYPYQIQQIDVWTYNFGSNKFIQELIFRNGRLHRINSLGYGY
jgi:hypothetical protein